MSNAASGIRDSYENDLDRPLGAPRAFRDDYRPRRPRPYVSDRTYIDPHGRRTVKIRGQATPARRRPQTVDMKRYGQSPDRAAMWALVLGVFLVVVAVFTGS
jgi:hypothetical protein